MGGKILLQSGNGDSPIKLAVFGTKSITNIHLVVKAIKLSGFVPTHIYVGTTRFCDKLTITLAEHNNIPWTVIKAEWNIHRRIANHRRIEKILDIVDGAVILRKGWYRFSQQAVHAAQLSGKPTQVVEFNSRDDIIKNYCLNWHGVFNKTYDLP